MKEGHRLFKWRVPFLLFCFCLPAQAQEKLSLQMALQMALQKNVDILLQDSQLQQAQAQQQQAQGAFDTTLSASASQERKITPLAQAAADGSTRQSKSNNINYQFGLSKLLPRGMLLESNVSASSQRDTSASGVNSPAQNLLRFNLSLNLPLAKGAGLDLAQAAVNVADLNLLLSQQALYQQTEQVLLNTLNAYWDYLARVELEKLARATVARSQQLLNSNQKLVDAGERPRGDLVLLQADLADKSAALQASGLALNEARRNLAHLLGLNTAHSEALAAPGEIFPPEDEVHSAQLSPAAREAVLQRRLDVRSAELQMQIAQQQMRIAQEKLKPKLDVEVGASYAKAGEGGTRYAFPFDNGRVQTEPSLYAQLKYEFPPANNLAQGQFRERSANYTQAKLKAQDVQQVAANNLNSAWQRVQAASAQLRATRLSLSLYEQAVQQELTKQRSGIATLLDVIGTESRFNSAQTSLIQLQADYAKAVARLRYESASLLPPGRRAGGVEQIELDVANLHKLRVLLQSLSPSNPPRP